ncbi:hypothetical protein [Ranid herpesvirus 3]|uniref:Uncharacterized protein n=1 Tax=Ranid herpesvirus 3 TaxID=1987509 RepID=A0A1X9T5A1_9VIRU|nr:hypothetical protein [Ranid herpesvirus 3]ARR28881.1 hypothetical protein [Ranid herpesvirus 3]
MGLCCTLLCYGVLVLLGVFFVTLSGGVLDDFACGNFSEIVLTESKSTYRNTGWFIIMCVVVSLGRCLAVRIMYAHASVAAELVSKTFRKRGRPKDRDERTQRSKRNKNSRAVKSLTWIFLGLVSAVVSAYHTASFHRLVVDGLVSYHLSNLCWYIPITFGVLSVLNSFGIVCLLIMLFTCLLQYGAEGNYGGKEVSGELYKPLINDEEGGGEYVTEEDCEDVEISRSGLPGKGIIGKETSPNLA